MNSRLSNSELRSVRIAGTGSYLPGPPLVTESVTRFLRRFPDGLTVAQQDRLISESGIETRHYAIDVDDDRKRETNASMAAAAGRAALDAAGWKPHDVDLLVVTTVVPDQLMPPTSTMVQELLGIENCSELAISANCTAPTKGLMVAADQIQVGRVQRALVCSAQFASFGFVPPWSNPASMNPQQGHLRWILSDGAGAIALERSDQDMSLRVHLESRGVGIPSGMSVAVGAAYPDLGATVRAGAQHVTQPPLFALKHGMRLAKDGLQRMLRATELPGTSIDHFIPSISSMQVARKMEKVFGTLGVRPDAWRLNFTRVGYVGSVAVPIMLDEMVRAKQLRPGDVVCTVAEESSKWMFAGTVFRW
jgi:3-oxoacyl-[acyl-carrier-protein] synthase-3